MDGVKEDMSSMLNSMTNWWGSAAQTDTQTDPKTPDENKEKTDSAAESPVKDQVAESNTDSNKTDDEPAEPEAAKNEGGDKSVDINIDEMSAKAIDAAKEWGSYLYSFGKTATVQVTEQVSKTAKVLKDTIDDKTMIGNFHEMQNKFVNENSDKRKKSEASVAPWVGYNEEEAMKSQIMALSADKRNFLRNPPAGVQFNFDFESSFPVAAAMLQEDPKLIKMRFELVPKQVKEDIFWRNYFYRVSLIKQSAQLTSLAQQAGSPDAKSSGSKSDLSPKGSPKSANRNIEDDKEVEEFVPGSPTEHEFASDAFQAELNEEDMKKEMQQLGMSDKEGLEGKKDDMPEWEQELQAELQEYEVVDDDTGLDDDDLEQEILDQLEAESGAK